MEAIDLKESKLLIELEAVVSEGKDSFVRVGMALAEIKAKRLYRSDFETFEEYCRTRWGWSRQHCYRLIDAAEVVSGLSGCNPMGDTQTPAINERTARELVSVPKPKRAAVLKRAAASGRVTGESVREAKAELVEDEPPRIKTADEELCADELEMIRQYVAYIRTDAMLLERWACDKRHDRDDLNQLAAVLEEHASRLRETANTYLHKDAAK